jgi:hypothetical protein
MQFESLAIDKKDHANFTNQEPERAEPSTTENAQMCNPFFFNHQRAPLHLTGTYRNASAFLIGGGPSFARVDKYRLDPVWTMTLNNASASYRGKAACFVDDPSRFSLSVWLDPTIQKFVPISALTKTLWDNRLLTAGKKVGQKWQASDVKLGDCPNVVGYRRNEKFDAARFLYENTINWGCHAKFGGGRSVMLPALRILFLLGFRRVYLLGVDFEMSGTKKYHFCEDRPPNTIRSNMQTYAKLQKWFAELQPHFLKEHFVIKNCNSESKLKVFPLVSLDDAIAEATETLGDYTMERTFGMYKPVSQKDHGNRAWLAKGV